MNGTQNIEPHESGQVPIEQCYKLPFLSSHGSLFSGIGGFDLAAEQAGLENIFHCEFEEYKRKQEEEFKEFREFMELYNKRNKK